MRKNLDIKLYWIGCIIIFVLCVWISWGSNSPIYGNNGKGLPLDNWMDINGGDDAQNSEDGLVWVMIKHQIWGTPFSVKPKWIYSGYQMG
jgi:hypothetical protein